VLVSLDRLLQWHTEKNSVTLYPPNFVINYKINFIRSLYVCVCVSVCSRCVGSIAPSSFKRIQGFSTTEIPSRIVCYCLCVCCPFECFIWIPKSWMSSSLAFNIKRRPYVRDDSYLDQICMCIGVCGLEWMNNITSLCTLTCICLFEWVGVCGRNICIHIYISLTRIMTGPIGGSQNEARFCSDIVGQGERE
jgi:hypothetical protein